VTIAWLRRNLFSGPLDTALTLLTLALLAWILPVALNWLVFDAVWGHAPVAACDAVRGQGACWAVVWEKFRFMMFGTYPYDEQWRPAIVIVLLCALLVVSGIKRFWNGWLAVIWTVGIALTWWLMGGGAGLQPVRSEQWGGLPVTLILAIFGIAFAFPLGVALALGRRSKLPIVRALSVVYIEVVRGVPLITVLFMASVMFALFMPEGMRIDQLLRAQIAIILFVAAYLAEAVRGGLQAVPRGQVEAALALGLRPWMTTLTVVLPQALTAVLPAIMNVFIAFFKATSIVVVVGIFDLMTAARRAVADAQWQGFGTEVYLFVAAIYFAFCYAMSRYSARIEATRQAGRGH